jgi:hypothetical protein
MRQGLFYQTAPRHTQETIILQQHKQLMYKRNNEARSRDRWRRKKSNNYYMFWVSICSFSDTVLNAHAPYYIVICGLSGSNNIFSDYLINGTIFGGKKLLNI